MFDSFSLSPPLRLPCHAVARHAAKADVPFPHSSSVLIRAHPWLILSPQHLGNSESQKLYPIPNSSFAPLVVSPLLSADKVMGR